MSVAIVTKYHGPTTNRGARITASVPSRIADRDRDRQPGETGYELHQPAHWRLTIPYPYELSGEAVHRGAAEALADRLGWSGDLAGGALADGYAFVIVDHTDMVLSRARRDAAIGPAPDDGGPAFVPSAYDARYCMHCGIRRDLHTAAEPLVTKYHGR